MTEESSFEIINKKPHDSEISDNDQKESLRSASLVTSTIALSSLPTFVAATANNASPSSSNVFHSASFRPEIPANKSESNLYTAAKDEANEEFENSGILGASLFGWVKDTVSNKGTTLLTKVAEKAKNSVGSVITTLDPQMKDFISSDNDFQEIIVTSDKEVEVSSVRESFQNILNKICVRGFEADEIDVAKQIVGFEAASRAAFLRIENIRSQHPVSGPLISVQNFIVEISDDKWYDLDLLVLHDFEKGMQLETYSQMTPIPTSIVNVAKEDTEKDYKHLKTGFSVTVAHIMGNNLQVHPSEWHETLTGVSRRTRVLFAARVLANLYKNTLL